MSKRKPGEWWDKSWSVVTGCTPAGAGCDHCWARGMIKRFPAPHTAGFSGLVTTRDQAFSTVRCHPERLDQPLRRRKPTVYAASLLGDVFHGDVPFEFLLRAFAVMNRAKQHTFCVLTKRPERVVEFVAEFGLQEDSAGRTGSGVSMPANVILLASIWDQDSADAACRALCRMRGVKWGLHGEPLLDSIDLRWAFRGQLPGKTGPAPAPSWVVCGAEQGPGARPFDLDWARSLRDQCKAASVPFWFKSGPKRSEPPADLAVREVPW